jgi:hypothetical protein
MPLRSDTAITSWGAERIIGLPCVANLPHDVFWGEVEIDLGGGEAVVDDVYSARRIHRSPLVLGLLTIHDTGQAASGTPLPV